LEWESRSEPDLAIMTSRPTLIRRRSVRTGITRIIRMLALRMGIMVHSGLRAEFSSAPDLGITGAGAMADTTAAPDTTAEAGVTDGATCAAVTSTDMLEAASLDAENITVEVKPGAAVVSTGEAVSTEVADRMGADTGNDPGL
jgi:hypothetical protein